MYALWLRYEEGADRLATIAKEIDKYQALELALKYEQQHNIPLFSEFDTYSSKHISQPALNHKLKKLRERHMEFIRTN